MKLSPPERLELLRIARDAIERHLVASDRTPPAASRMPRLGRAFVTIRTAGELRGCIGSVDSGELLVSVVSRCAVLASAEDPRFPPLTAEELSLLRIEISVLGPFEPVGDVAEIEIGRHGLIVEQGLRRGLLLPQVATEQAWDRETFLRHACLKAALHPEAWRKGATIYKFEAEVFGEEEPT
ncbi:MAG: AmmeMemoRadiSam system protein A [Acidobacteria bacterium]|nr:AmmeMemoRadiSam system protein A [Acidobacteriota bacterium]